MDIILESYFIPLELKINLLKKLWLNDKLIKLLCEITNEPTKLEIENSSLKLCGDPSYNYEKKEIQKILSINDNISNKGLIALASVIINDISKLYFLSFFDDKFGKEFEKTSFSPRKLPVDLKIIKDSFGQVQLTSHIIYDKVKFRSLMNQKLC